MQVAMEIREKCVRAYPDGLEHFFHVQMGIFLFEAGQIECQVVCALLAQKSALWCPFDRAPCLFLAIIKERYEEDLGYQYMCNFP